VLLIAWNGKWDIALTFFKIAHLARGEVSGGLSGAELVAACRDAALVALEEDEKMEDAYSSPMIRMHHILGALTSIERQITQEMLDFYANYQGKAK
jgi:SpoVK/Ycf46/Vps4 family AAA+-type ATPase